MTVSEAIAKMQALAYSAKEKLDIYGFDIKIETDCMDSRLRTVSTPEKSRFATVALIIGGNGINEGEEYCLSIGVAVRGKNVNDGQLEQDSSKFVELVDETISVLEAHENKTDAIKILTEKATEEYNKLLAEIEENRQKSRRISLISNVAFVVGIIILMIVAAARS